MVVRRLLLDAFGTVFSPREPVFQQYTSVARSFGLQVEEGRVKEGFKQAFKNWATAHPLYGKRSTPPLDAEQWWTGVIYETFRRAGVPESDFEPVSARLCDTLVHRFWGEEGYALHDDVHPLLHSLYTFDIPPPIIVSNTDPSVSRILRALGAIEGQTDPVDAGIRESEVWTTWELEQEKGGTAFWEEVLVRLKAAARERGEDELEADEVLVVGDEAVSDYEAPRRVGMQSLLLRRKPVGEHARASYSDDERGVAEHHTVASLLEVVESSTASRTSRSSRTRSATSPCPSSASVTLLRPPSSSLSQSLPPALHPRHCTATSATSLRRPHPLRPAASSALRRKSARSFGERREQSSAQLARPQVEHRRNDKLCAAALRPPVAREQSARAG